MLLPLLGWRGLLLKVAGSLGRPWNVMAGIARSAHLAQ